MSSVLTRRNFVSLLGGSISAFEGKAWAEDSTDAEEEALIFDGTGIREADGPRNQGYTPTRKHIPRPLWARRDTDEYRMDVATVEGYKAAQWLLRDVKAHRLGFPDVALLTALSRAQTALASLKLHSRFDFTSGLRTPATNASTEGAAQGSLHLPDEKGLFLAADFRARGFDASFTARLMNMVGMGGVGVYLQRDFVHADTGRKRQWVGK